MKLTYDVLLVGNGVIALAIAWELKRRDRSLRVAVIGPFDRLGSGSAAAGAMLGCFGEVTHTSLKSSAGRAKFDLIRRSSDIWRTWIGDLNDLKINDRQLLRPINGTIVIENAVSDTLDSDNFDAIIAAMDAYKEPYEPISPRNIDAIHPVP